MEIVVKKTILLIASLIAVTLSASAYAGSSRGTVENVTVNILSRVFFEAGTPVNQPTCAQQVSWALDASTPEGRAMYALILTAQANGNEIIVTGNNLCGVQADRETVQFMQQAPN